MQLSVCLPAGMGQTRRDSLGGPGGPSQEEPCQDCEDQQALMVAVEQCFDKLGICNHRLRHYFLSHYHPYLQRRGSPRTSQSPFTGSPDPLLLSPHSMSPNSSLRQQQSQVSPPFSQGTMTSTGFSSAGPPAYSTVSVSSSGPPSVGAVSSFSPTTPHHPMGGPAPPSSSSSQPFPEFGEFPEFMNAALSDSKKMAGEMPMSSTQYVKQELRNICSARSEKTIQQHLQQQQQQQQQQKQHQQQQQQKQQQQQQQQSTQQSLQLPVLPMDFETGSELPQHILETIDNMTQDHGGRPAGEEEVVAPLRHEASMRYEQFRLLSNANSADVLPVGGGCSGAEPESPEQESAVKAASLFRAQLLSRQTLASGAPQASTSVSTSGGKGSTNTPTISLVLKEPRPRVPVDVKPMDTKNSLLQQLLADSNQ
ncbi:hypothetical protein ACOMHN_052034 [Nucella lapillus]